MPLQATSGTASYDAFGGGVAAVPNYIEDVFSTYLIKTPGSATAVGAVNNAIDLSTKGGMVWLKDRNFAYSHTLVDSARGVTQRLISNSTAAQASTSTYGFTSFNTDGFTLGAGGGVLFDNGAAGTNVVSWTFRKQPKFFDVVTFVAGSSTNRTVSHSLGSVPGFYVMKDVSAVSQWPAYHRSLGANQYLALNKTDAVTTYSGAWGTGPTSTTFSVDETGFCTPGNTYVVYLFAHDAGGFGLTGTDNVISCGSFTTSSGVSGLVNIGYEPQWVLIKRTDSSVLGDWQIYDTMRGAVATNNAGTYDQPAQLLVPNTSAAEANTTGIGVYQQGFNFNNGTGTSTYIYIAIRRGPMKVPTTGTSVFGLSARSGTGANATVTGGQIDDAVLVKNRGSAVASLFASRLTSTGYLVTSSIAAEVAAGTTILQANPWDVMDGVKVGTTSTITNDSASTYINYLFKRAPSFMDVVCYSGTGIAKTETHNLKAVPELMIVKRRSGGTGSWRVYDATNGATKFLILNGTDKSDLDGGAFWNGTAPTSSVFSLGTNAGVNGSGSTFIAYLFATCAGVSKVGTYTGNGTTQTIDCGLTAGARFVLIKRTDAVGSWYVYDTARGMTTLTDPYWLTESTAAEVATLGSVTTVATGFAVNSAILAAINTNAATYIFLAIA